MRFAFLVFLFIPAAFAEKSVILFLGDSLTAGYGVRSDESYPSRLAQAWKSAGRDVQVINGAESGSLSSSLPTRVAFYSGRMKPRLVIIASGGNDARQLTPVSEIQKNLQNTIEAAKATGAKVALAEMRIFPNLGKEYADSFQALYKNLAKKNKITLVPFFLEGVAGVSAMNQADGFHPNPAGHEKIAKFLQPYLENLL